MDSLQRILETTTDGIEEGDVRGVSKGLEREEGWLIGWMILEKKTYITALESYDIFFCLLKKCESDLVHVTSRSGCLSTLPLAMNPRA